MKEKQAPFSLERSFHEALQLHRQGRLREAEKIYARILKAAPNHFDALNLLGAVKLQLGQIGEARRLLSAAVKVNPRVPQAWLHLGEVFHALKRREEALDCFGKACALAPDDVDILNRHANALLTADRARDALGEFQQILARMPQHVEARVNCGIAHAALGSPEAALAEFDRALSIAPGHPNVQYSRGIALYDLGRYAEAAEANAVVLAGAPDHAGAWLHHGRALAALGWFEEAIADYSEALELREDNADARFMMALAQLTIGDYAHGFVNYEWRWRRSGMPAPKSRGRPLWLGEYPLPRKTILVHAEQGFGDTIQFARYVPVLAAGGARVVVEVPAELTALMASLDGAAAIVASGAPSPPFDVHCPLGSLPLALKTEPATVPARIPYLAADQAHLAKWSARLGGLERPCIALAWAGNPSHANDRNRSVRFAHLAPLFAGPGHFIAVQRDVREEDAAALAGERRLFNVGAELESFSDTAAVIALADLVITVDTAVAHLAGAMGTPVWVMLPFTPDWRWTRQGETTPWYPTARLFRQDSPGDWDGVIARIGAAVRQFAPR